MSYGTTVLDRWRRAATYVDKDAGKDSGQKLTDASNTGVARPCNTSPRLPPLLIDISY
jgi:hypothetical protein